jgi:ABC-type nitrate/sulfonate/bicarbonate transport system permease component
MLVTNRQGETGEDRSSPSPGRSGQAPVAEAPSAHRVKSKVRRRRVARRPYISRRAHFLLGACGIVGTLLVWQCADWLGWVNPLTWSSPSAVWHAGVEAVRSGDLQTAIGESLSLFAIGFGISAVIGIGCGALLGWYRRANAVLDPVVSLFYALPRIALIPLVIAIVGPNFTAQVVVVVLLGAFPIMINVASGIAAINEDHVRLARSFLATNGDMLRTIALPGAIPAIISGLRQGMNLALAGVVVAEYFIGADGVGGMIFKAGLILDTSTAIVGALVFAFGALLLTWTLQLIEHRLNRWRTS